MSNHYYANDAVINDQHKELNIHGNLTTQQVLMIAKDFFAEETMVTEENDEAEVYKNSTEVDEDAKAAETTEPAKTTETIEAVGEAPKKEIFRFVHPALEEEEEWRVHREVERLVKRFDVQEICMRLNQLKKEGKVLLPQNTKNAHEELKRMGMPAEKAGFEYKTFCKYYNKD